ncbi:MAG: DoxX family protein [Myxococcales bacterium]|nr:DoxX family protein [Myxococcales bacterium]
MSKIQRIAPHAARLVLGLLFTVFGLNGFLHFIPNPPVPEAAGSFLGALAATGYMFPLIKGTEVVAGLALLSNRFVPLALIALSPIVVNIFAFHTLLAPAPIGVVLVLLTGYLGYAYRSHFAALFAARAQPEPSSSASALRQRLADAE